MLMKNTQYKPKRKLRGKNDPAISCSLEISFISTHNTDWTFKYRFKYLKVISIWKALIRSLNNDYKSLRHIQRFTVQFYCVQQLPCNKYQCPLEWWSALTDRNNTELFFSKTKYCTRICKTRHSVSTHTECNVNDQRSTVVAKWVQKFTHNWPVFYKSSCIFSRTYKYQSVWMINSTAIFLYLLFKTLNLTYFNVMSTFQDIFF